MHIYLSLHWWIPCATRSIFSVRRIFWGHMTNTAHLGASHDQYKTLLVSRDDYHTHFKHVESHDKHRYNTYFTLYLLGQHLLWLSSWRKATAFTLFWWILRVTKWQSHNRLIPHPVVKPPSQKLYSNKSTKGTDVCELMVLGVWSWLTIQHSDNASCCIYHNLNCTPRTLSWRTALPSVLWLLCINSLNS